MSISPPESLRRLLVPGPAPGKPRMTQRDKWAQRPCVMEYRAWADSVRQVCGTPPAAELTEHIFIRAFYRPPESWSKARQAAAIGQRKRTKPDPDNIGKAVLDAIWKQDAAVGDVTVERRWASQDVTVIEITLECAA